MDIEMKFPTKTLTHLVCAVERWPNSLVSIWRLLPSQCTIFIFFKPVCLSWRWYRWRVGLPHNHKSRLFNIANILHWYASTKP